MPCQGNYRRCIYATVGVEYDNAFGRIMAKMVAPIVQRIAFPAQLAVMANDDFAIEGPGPFRRVVIAIVGDNHNPDPI
jgi:hypothetical protein